MTSQPLSPFIIAARNRNAEKVKSRTDMTCRFAAELSSIISAFDAAFGFEELFFLPLLLVAILRLPKIKIQIICTLRTSLSAFFTFYHAVQPAYHIGQAAYVVDQSAFHRQLAVKD